MVTRIQYYKDPRTRFTEHTNSWKIRELFRKWDPASILNGIKEK